MLHHINDAEMVAKDFGPRLKGVLETLHWSCGELATRCGVDPSTLQRIINGQTQPLLATTAKVVRAVARENHGLGVALFTRFAAALTPDPDVSADYNGDGKADRDDLVPICAALVRSTSDAFDSVIDAIADGRVTDDEMLRVRKLTAEIRNHCNALNSVVDGMNDIHSHMAHRRA